jgi:hypothetical protein
LPFASPPISSGDSQFATRLAALQLAFMLPSFPGKPNAKTHRSSRIPPRLLAPLRLQPCLDPFAELLAGHEVSVSGWVALRTLYAQFETSHAAVIKSAALPRLASC